MISKNQAAMNFEAILNQLSDEPSATSLTIPASWGQGNTIFGGLTSALLYKAMRGKIEASRVLRSMNTSFVSALKAGVPFAIEVEVLREGRSVTQILARIIQNEQTAIVTQASFGKNRESRISVNAKQKSHQKMPQEGLIFEHKEGFTPAFLGHFDISMCRGSVPFSNSSSHDLGGWMRFKDALVAPTDAHLIAMIDVWPATILQMFDSVAPASSLSWNLEFIHPHSPFNLDSWFAYEASTRQAASGYAHTEANIWNEAGELIAISRQAVVAYQ